ncbi:hypothetical protein P7C73_g3296, partial [Tremellales sp. Uapishka_1]
MTPYWSQPRFGYLPSSSRVPSAENTPTIPHFAVSPLRGSASIGPGAERWEMIEIPRFKKRELNLNIVRRRGLMERLSWIALWLFWVTNGLLSLYFDVDVIYMLAQCAIHASFETNSANLWRFATAAYAICWGISVSVVWLGWEMAYEFWRRWRLPRPAIEPIYFSLPASLYLALMSFPHYTFLLHVRLSPLSTPHRLDILAETFHAFVQLIPGLLLLLPRAALAIVLLSNFSSAQSDVQAPLGGAVDQTAKRDPQFFNPGSGELSTYAKGVLYTFLAWVGMRLVLVIGSVIGLWLFSARPLGGLYGRGRLKSQAKQPSTPRKPKSSIVPHDPTVRRSPQKSFLNENDFMWEWKDRARSRIQDAFELCMIKANNKSMSFLGEPSTPWGQRRSPSHLGRDHGVGMQPVVQANSTPPVSAKPSLEPPRPESMLDPDASSLPRLISRKATSNTNASTSTQDLFYTPAGGNTPQIHRSTTGVTRSTTGVTSFPLSERSPSMAEPMANEAPHPSSAFKTPSTGSGTGSDDGSAESTQDDSVGLLSREPSLRQEASGSLSSKQLSITRSTDSSLNRKRANSSSTPTEKILNRARSTSVTILNASEGLIRRARSGTIMSSESQYSKMNGADSDEDDFGGEGGISRNHGSPLPRRRSKLGLGPPPSGIVDVRASTH